MHIILNYYTGQHGYWINVRHYISNGHPFNILLVVH